MRHAALFGLIVLLVVSPSTALAHAFLDRADPPVGSTVKSTPSQVRIWFTENLEPAFSRIRVLNQAGQQVDLNDSQADPSNAALLRISIPPLSPGAYKVIWRVLSVDTHITEGDFTFRIAP